MTTDQSASLTTYEPYDSRMPSAVSAASTRTRLLDATSTAIARHGPRKVSLTDIAALAGVSRPTLYRHFASKEELLLALSAHETERFESLMAAALRGLDGSERLDRAMRFIVEFQNAYPLSGLVTIEPAFMLDQLERALRTMADLLVPMLENHEPTAGRAAEPADLADLVVRIALSNFLIPGDDARLLRELRHVCGLDG